MVFPLRILACLLGGVCLGVPHGAAETAHAGRALDVRHAVGFSARIHDTHTLVQVRDPAPGDRRTLRYLLVPRGQPVPDVEADAVVRTPVRRVVALSTTCIPHLAHCGAMDTLVGVERGTYVSTPAARARIAAGQARAVGDGASVDAERVLALQPDLVLSYVLDDARRGAHALLDRAGIPVVLTGSYMEQSPLGRCEWIKFTALFLEAGDTAAAFFRDVETAYTGLVARAAAADTRPTVLMNAPFRGQWHVPGGRSYAARLVADAGGRYLWADDARTSGVPVPFEAVFARAADADVWLHPSAWRTRADGLAEDERFALFKAFRTGRIYNSNARLNPDGGNDIFENGVARPDQVLADLVHILHPEQLPDHELVWYRALP